MKTVKFRDLINPAILNAGWIGFNGDSEYISEDGELMYGNWTFVDIKKNAILNKEELEADLEEGVINDESEFIGINWTLDDSIPEHILSKGLTFEVENDKGQLCLINIIY